MALLSEDLRAQLASGQAVIIAGAGVSLSATDGAPLASWRGLLEDGIERCAGVADIPNGWADVQHATLALGDVESWLSVAEQVTQRLGGRDGGEFRRWLRETVGAFAIADGARGLLEALVGLGLPICTTNYDGLIDKVAGVDAVTWRDGPRAQLVLRGDDTGIIHLHGHWRDSESVILGVRSYGAVLADGSAQAMLKALATMRSLVLVGFGAGLDDPNFRALRTWMAQTWSSSEYRHYRLVSESEREAVLAGAAPEGERIQPVVYGQEHAELEGFLRDIAGSQAPRGRATFGDASPITAASLPAPRPFFGREDLVERLVAAVLEVEPPPVPVLGPPGIGKSALTQASAHDPRVVERFGARRFWVRCDSAESAASVAADIALALGITGTDSPEAAIVAALTHAPALLLLDNAETPWEGDLLGTEELLCRLAAVPGLSLVCSFRGAQRPIGPQWTDSIVVPQLRSEPAKEVFLAAAGHHHAGDPRLPALLSDVDGMPIAIELLGRLAQPEADLEGLRRRWEKHRTDLLEAGNDPDRYRSIAISFDLSIANPQLPERARHLLSVLAHLPDGVEAAAIDAIFDDGDNAMADLRRVGLAFDEDRRVRILKPIRDHVAAHYVATAADLDHASTYYLDLARRRGGDVGTERGTHAVSTLAGESGNLSFAINRAYDGAAVTQGIDAALALTNLGRFSGLPIKPLTARAMERAREIGDVPREAHAAFGLGALAESDHDTARQAYEQALTLYRQLGNALGEAASIRGLGDIAFARSDHDTARQAYEQALTLYRQLGDALGEANCISRLGNIAFERADHDTARQAYEQALTLYRQLGDALGEANCIKSLGDIAFARADHDTARQAYEQALTLYRQLGDALGEANCIKSLGNIAFERADHATTAQAYEQALTLYRQLGNALGEANCIRGLGDIARKRADHDTARQAYEQALTLYTSVAEPYSIGFVHRSMAMLHEADDAEQLRLAKEAWLGIGREDLVERYLQAGDG